METEENKTNPMDYSFDLRSPMDHMDIVDELVPAENNLEFLPTEILLEIFARVDDIKLLHLSATSHRFEAIAQMVLKRRYADEYFLIDGESEHFIPELYWTQFKCFGNVIKAIELKNVNDVDGNHWLPQILRRHTQNIERIHINSCHFKDSTEFLSQHLNINHLTCSRFVDDCEYVELPKYRHLTSLELNDSPGITVQSLEQIFRDNPQLESLKVFYPQFRFTVSMIVYLVCKHLRHLKELKVQQSPSPMNWLINIPDSFIDESITCLEHLESLSIFADYEFRDCLKWFLPKCKNIKRLKLNYWSCEMSRIVETFQSFDKLEVLSLYRPREMVAEIELIVQSLPCLRKFILSFETFSKSDYIDTLSLLHKYKNLDQIIIQNTDYDSTHYVDVLSYHKLVRASLNPNVRVEFTTLNDEVIGIITKKELIWRNKVMHWIGYDPKYSKSNISLLDLPNPQRSNTESVKPFEMVLDYLDLSSLCSLARVSKKSNKLIESYIQKRSNRQEKFVITNEFPINYEELRTFGPYINNLEVINLHIAMDFHERQHDLTELHSTIEKYFTNLRKLCFYSKADLYPLNFIFPQIRHMVFCAHSGYCDLSTWSSICADLETLELNSKITNCDESHSFRNLKKFIFWSSDQSEMGLVKELFRNMQTKVTVKCY